MLTGERQETTLSSPCKEFGFTKLLFLSGASPSIVPKAEGADHGGVGFQDRRSTSAHYKTLESS
jgi:hypothetical protein